MACGPATCSTCSISQPVTAASLPFSQAGPLKNRQATMSQQASNARRFTCWHEDREVVEAGLFDRVVETIDIIAEERVTHQEPLETLGNLTEESRMVFNTEKVTDKDALHSTRHFSQTGGRPGNMLYV